METPGEFDRGFQIIFKSEFGKGEMIFGFMEFIGWFELTHGKGSCYEQMLRELYAAIKAGAVKEEIRRLREEGCGKGAIGRVFGVHRYPLVSGEHIHRGAEQ